MYHHDISEMENAIAKVKTDMDIAIEAKVNNAITGVENKVEAAIDDVMNNMNSADTGVKTKMTSTIADVKAEMNTAIADVKSEMKTAIIDVKHTVETLIKGIQNKLDDMEKLIAKPQSTRKQTEHTDIQATQMPAKRFSSCLEIYRDGMRHNGVYEIYLTPGSTSIKVFCDMKTDGGGWTVFQRRQDGSEDFFRTWEEYASGFGDLEGEFWLGNDYISDLTSKCCHELRVDLEDFEGNTAFAKYSKFQVLPSKDNYRLEVSGYSGNASDSLASKHSGMEFSTKDRDNDIDRKRNCAEKCSGAWWYWHCHVSNLNSVYLRGTEGQWERGVAWFNWKISYYSMKRTEMKLR